jgi:hypothetical protein
MYACSPSSKPGYKPHVSALEALKRVAGVQAQLYLPKWVPTKWMRLFTQPWEGDVTILLPWRLYAKSIAKVIHNPEQFELVNADREGILAAWAHMSAIQVLPHNLLLRRGMRMPTTA